ncbi:MAG: PLP-dependent aminotransferase family protein [Clostridiaceae bacterium]
MFGITINKDIKTPLFFQIYNEMKIQILNGAFCPGDKLPSTRELSLSLNVSRSIIQESYDQLWAEGYITNKHGSGTYVSKGTFLCNSSNHTSKSSYFTKADFENTNLIDFQTGVPALDLIPKQKWGKIYKDVCNRINTTYLGYNLPQGSSELRSILCEYLFRTRGVQCTAEQIIITSGAVQAITLISRLLLSEDDNVIVEDPINKDIQKIFKLACATLLPLSVDDHGLQTAYLPQDENPKFIYTTPSHQFPMGGVLPISRRIQLINYAVSKNCFIIEDDYDSEFRYNGFPISSFQGLSPSRVIYIGTFSKILSPALRIGYIILPPELVEEFCELKRLEDLHSPIIEQLTLAQFIEEHHLNRHIRKLKKLYHSKQKHLINCLKNNFDNEVQIKGTSAGLHLVAKFPKVTFTEDLLTKLVEYGVKVYSVEQHSIRKNIHSNEIILGYGNLSETDITEGVKRIKDCILSLF